MLKLFLAALLTTATALPAEAVELSPRIAGGTPATSGDFNFTVSIMIGDQHVCGGALLGPDTVLTAAHCIQEGHPISSYKVRAGSLDCKTGGTVVGVRSMTPHSSYTTTHDGTSVHDIAIFKLSEPIPESSSISYAKVQQQNADLPAQANATIAGCGKVSAGENAPSASMLQVARATIVDRNACRNSVSGLTENMICVGASAGPDGVAPQAPGLFDWTGGPAMPGQTEARGICSGDSGGPVVVNGEVVGVASFVLGEPKEPGGTVCQALNKPAFATRVDKYVDRFIKPALQVNGEAPGVTRV
ncbi:Peptidase cysteine/serine, trypsin-like protein [Metarhizium guizhouense ARSEF 977]|uniref:Peptidase cysteine/serine, trypsin-like protein n=1 Tax=Metarhizium guizhouense (strain ARSEF 977) TaxID=1276136 RepID=A0A0B4I2B2_METGA|nr:Peptidase cysteine/serine, trypsin-like protein [Metarhizium guizhouense ARSEF 977]